MVAPASWYESAEYAKRFRYLCVLHARALLVAFPGTGTVPRKVANDPGAMARLDVWERRGEGDIWMRFVDGEATKEELDESMKRYIAWWGDETRRQGAGVSL